jgi:hypothetical protein
MTRAPIAAINVNVRFDFMVFSQRVNALNGMR